MIEIIAYGIPAPQVAKSFVGVSKSGKGLMVESSKKVKPWRATVVLAAKAAMAERAPLDGPLSVSMVFTVPKPKSAPKTRRTWPDTRPDLSKLARSTEDALTDAGVYVDDARIVSYSWLSKVYPGEDADALSEPGVRIVVRPLT